MDTINSASQLYRLVFSLVTIILIKSLLAKIKERLKPTVRFTDGATDGHC